MRRNPIEPVPPYAGCIVSTRADPPYGRMVVRGAQIESKRINYFLGCITCGSKNVLNSTK